MGRGLLLWLIGIPIPIILQGSTKYRAYPIHRAQARGQVVVGSLRTWNESFPYNEKR
jgi:hypothetical protein